MTYGDKALSVRISRLEQSATCFAQVEVWRKAPKEP